MTKRSPSPASMLAILGVLAEVLAESSPSPDVLLQNLGADFLAVCPLSPEVVAKLTALTQDNPDGPLGPGLMIAVPKRKAADAVALLSREGITINASFDKEQRDWSRELRDVVRANMPAGYGVTSKNLDADFPRPMGVRPPDAEIEKDVQEPLCDCDFCTAERERENARNN